MLLRKRSPPAPLSSPLTPAVPAHASFPSARRPNQNESHPNSASREKYGLLEKRKDYLLRARDFHRKERTLKQLQRKAEERNPDEFYHAMERQRTKGGVHQAAPGGGGGGGGGASGGASGANKYSQEELALMRTQDVGYVGSRARAEASRIGRLRASLHFVGATDGLGGGGSDDDEDDEDESDDGGGGGGGGHGRRPLKRARHTVFVDTSAEAAAFSPEDFFDTPGELLGRAHNRPRRAQMKLLSGGGGGGGAAGEGGAAGRSGGGGGGAGGSGAPALAARAAGGATDAAEDDDAARLRRAAEAAAKHERALLLAASAASADGAPASAGGGKRGRESGSGSGGGSVRALERARAASYAELALREDRARRLRRVEEHLGLARLMAGARGKGPGGRTRKLRREQMQPGTPANVKVFKWRQERRR